MRGRTSKRNSAQMHTLEGLTAAVIVTMAAFFMVQSLAITPTSSSTASKAAEAEMQQMGNDVLAQSHANGDLKEAILQWEDDGNQYEGARAVSFRGTPPPNDFGDTLDNAFDRQGVAYNVDLRYIRPNTTRYSSAWSYVDNGDATDNAVVATQKIVLRHDDALTAGDEEVLTDEDERTNTRSFPIDGFTRDNADYRPGMYNIVEVRLTIWRK